MRKPTEILLRNISMNLESGTYVCGLNSVSYKLYSKRYIKDKCLPQYCMKMKSFVLLCLIVLTYGQISEAAKGVNKKTSVAKNTTSSTNQATTSRPQQSGFKLPCSCVEGQCGCCTGLLLEQFNQKACLNMSYEPEDFSLTAMMTMNQRVLYKRTVSGKNPPPMCFRLPRLQFIRLCVQFSNIYFASRNIHLCIDMEANWEDFTLVEWSFECVRMGASGVAVVRPEDGGGLPPNPVDVVDQTDEDYDDSARNVPNRHNVSLNTLRLTHFNKLIFDESLKRAERRNYDKRLIKINKLPNGDVLLSYD